MANETHKEFIEKDKGFLTVIVTLILSRHDATGYGELLMIIDLLFRSSDTINDY